jgi:hypothetical protein
MMRGMRRLVAVPAFLLLLALSACADDEPAADQSSPTPTPTVSTVPGTSPSPTASSSAPDEPAGPSVTDEPPTATPSTGPPTALSTESIAATPETLDGYRALATGLGAFFTAARKMEKKHPDADPQNADDVDELLGDVYPDGVDLAVFGVEKASLTLCLTGPAATFQLLVSRDDGIRQVFGGGDCGDPAAVGAEADGDVVVDVTFDISGNRPEYVGTVVKGQNLAAQIADLDTWIRVLNEEMAG